ncbi:hypothetical protein ACSQ67_025596 [Phaseolus vulgaris]
MDQQGQQLAIVLLQRSNKAEIAEALFRYTALQFPAFLPQAVDLNNGQIFLTSKNASSRVHGFTFGDDLDENSRASGWTFKARLNKVLIPLFLSRILSLYATFLSLEEPWTLILDDALANSFVAPAIDDPKEDNQLACKISNSYIKLYFERIKFTFSRVEILNSISMMPILFLYIWKVETSIFCSLKYLIRFNYRSCRDPESR